MKTTRTLVVLSAVLLVAVAIFFVLNRRAAAPIALARAEQTPPPPPPTMLPRGSGIAGAPATGLRKVEAVRNPMAQAPPASEPPFDKMPQASRPRDDQPPRLPSAVLSGGGGSGGTLSTNVRKAGAMTNPGEKAHLETEPHFDRKPRAAQVGVEQPSLPPPSSGASGGGGSGRTPLSTPIKRDDLK